MFMDQWNEWLVSHCFLRDSTKRARLNVHDSLLTELGELSGYTTQDFLEAAHNGFEGLPKRCNNVCLYATELLKTFRDQSPIPPAYRQQYLNFPPFIGYLCLFVYVESLGDGGFHRRLWDLFPPVEGPERNSYPDFYKIEDLWNALEKWSLHRDDAARFRTVRVGGYRYVGLLRAQLLLTDEDRSQLPSLFQEAGLESHEVLSLSRFQQILLDHPGRLLDRTRLRLLNPVGETEEMFQKEILEDVREELRQWDGYGPQPHGELHGHHRMRCQTQLQLFLRGRRGVAMPELRFSLSGVADESTATYRCDRFHGDVQATAVEGLSAPLVHNGTRLAVEQLEWSQTYVWTVTELVTGMPMRLSLRGRNIRLFLHATPYALGGYAETYLLPCSGKVWIAADAIGDTLLIEWFQHLPRPTVRRPPGPQLPTNWLWYEIDVPTDPMLRERCPTVIEREDVLATINVIGGVRIARNRYHTFAPPRIVLHGEVGTPQLTVCATEVTEQPLKCIDEHVYALPEMLPAGDYQIRLFIDGELQERIRLSLEDSVHAGNPREPDFIADQWGGPALRTDKGWSGALVRGENQLVFDPTALVTLADVASFWAVRGDRDLGDGECRHAIIPSRYFGALVVCFSQENAQSQAIECAEQVVAFHKNHQLIPMLGSQMLYHIFYTIQYLFHHRIDKVHSHCVAVTSVANNQHDRFESGLGFRDLEIELTALADDQFVKVGPLERFVRRVGSAQVPQYVAQWSAADHEWRVLRDHRVCCAWKAIEAVPWDLRLLGDHLALFQWLKTQGEGVNEVAEWPFNGSYLAILCNHPKAGRLHQELLAVAALREETRLELGQGMTFHGLADRPAVSPAARQAWQLAWLDRLSAHCDPAIIKQLATAGFSPADAMAVVTRAPQDWQTLYTRCLAIADVLLHIVREPKPGRAFCYAPQSHETVHSHD